MDDSALGIIGIIFLFVLYFLPSIIGRNKRNSTSIGVLNLFLGWTLIGWVIALIWATMHEESSQKNPTLMRPIEFIDKEEEERKKKIRRDAYIVTAITILVIIIILSLIP